MSLVTPDVSTPTLYQGFIAAEMWAILGGYKRGTFKHKNLNNYDINNLNEAQNMVVDTLERITKTEENTSHIFEGEKLEQSFDLEFLISLHPLIKTPFELKRELADYRNLLKDVIENKISGENKLDKAYEFFRRIALKSDTTDIGHLYARD